MPIMPVELRNHRSVWVACGLACLITSGCFNAQSLIDAHRADAINARLGEIDLGKFHISLPKPVHTMDVAEIHFHIFGQVANRDFKKVEESLEEKGIELRHRMLMATRQMDPELIQDPDLDSLRAHIVKVFNEILPGEPLQSIGFYSFSYTNF